MTALRLLPAAVLAISTLWPSGPAWASTPTLPGQESVAMPEPATVALLIAGLGLAGAVVRRRSLVAFLLGGLLRLLQRCRGALVRVLRIY